MTKLVYTHLKILQPKETRSQLLNLECQDFTTKETRIKIREKKEKRKRKENRRRKRKER